MGRLTTQVALSKFLEFLAATLEENVYLQEEKLRHAFNKFDRDGSGTISAEELA